MSADRVKNALVELALEMRRGNKTHDLNLQAAWKTGMEKIGEALQGVDAGIFMQTFAQGAKAAVEKSTEGKSSWPLSKRYVSYVMARKMYRDRAQKEWDPFYSELKKIVAPHFEKALVGKTCNEKFEETRKWASVLPEMSENSRNHDSIRKFSLSTTLGSFIAVQALDAYSKMIPDLQSERCEAMMHELTKLPFFIDDLETGEKLDKTFDALLQRAPELAVVPREMNFFWTTGGSGVRSNAKKKIPLDYMLNAAKFSNVNPDFTTTIWTDDVPFLKNSVHEMLALAGGVDRKSHGSRTQDEQIRIELKKLEKKLVGSGTLGRGIFFGKKRKSEWQDFVSEIGEARGVRKPVDASDRKAFVRSVSKRNMTLEDVTSALKKMRILPESEYFKEIRRHIALLDEGEGEKKKLLNLVKHLESGVACEISGDAAYRYPANGKDVFMMAGLGLGKGGYISDLDVEFKRKFNTMQAPFGFLGNVKFHFPSMMEEYFPPIMASAGYSENGRKAAERIAEYYQSHRRWQDKRAGDTRKTLSLGLVNEVFYVLGEHCGNACFRTLSHSINALGEERERGAFSIPPPELEYLKPVVAQGESSDEKEGKRRMRRASDPGTREGIEALPLSTIEPDEGERVDDAQENAGKGKIKYKWALQDWTLPWCQSWRAAPEKFAVEGRIYDCKLRESGLLLKKSKKMNFSIRCADQKMKFELKENEKNKKIMEDIRSYSSLGTVRVTKFSDESMEMEDLRKPLLLDRGDGVKGLPFGSFDAHEKYVDIARVNGFKGEYVRVGMLGEEMACFPIGAVARSLGLSIREIHETHAAGKLAGLRVKHGEKGMRCELPSRAHAMSR